MYVRIRLIVPLSVFYLRLIAVSTVGGLWINVFLVTTEGGSILISVAFLRSQVLLWMSSHIHISHGSLYVSIGALIGLSCCYSIGRDNSRTDEGRSSSHEVLASCLK